MDLIDFQLLPMKNFEYNFKFYIGGKTPQQEPPCISRHNENANQKTISVRGPNMRKYVRVLMFFRYSKTSIFKN